MKYLLLLLTLSARVAPLCAQEAPDQFPEPGAKEENYTMKITARVIDEDGNPLPDAPIRVSIHNVNDYKDMYNDFRGKTDAEGKFSAEGIGRGLAKIEVKKEGCYPSRKTVTCYEGTAEQIRETGKFLPWNPIVDIMVKEIGKPIPMLVRRGNRCRSRIKPEPEQIGKKLGWDLVEGDWVAPIGNGKVADLVVVFETTYKDESNRTASVQIGFGNKEDGCIPLLELKGEESLLKFPRNAPKEGYDVRKLEYSLQYKEVEEPRNYMNKTLTQLPNPLPEGYLLRLRTQKDKDGKVVSAIYGKITSPFGLKDILFRGNRRLFLNFDYYLNPTPNDRNLEYDQKSNLAPEADKDLRWPP